MKTPAVRVPIAVASVAAIVAVVAVLLAQTVPAARATDLEMLGQPCRIADTRVTSTPVAANSSSSFSFDYAASAGQGGTSGCGIPTTAKTAKLIIHSTPTTASSGYIKVYDGTISGAQVFASLVLDSAGQYRTIQLDVPTGGLSFAVYSNVQSHVVVDVIGWADGGGSAADDAPRLRRFLTTANAPFSPGAVSPGDRFLVASSGTVGTFVGHEGEWVYWDGSGWVFEVPRDGDLGFEAATGNYYRYRALGVAGWKQVELTP